VIAVRRISRPVSTADSSAAGKPAASNRTRTIWRGDASSLKPNLLLSRLAPQPFIRSITHRLTDGRLEPRHEGSVELEIVAAPRFEKPADILRVSIGFRQWSLARYLAAMPIERHDHTSPLEVHPICGASFCPPEVLTITYFRRFRQLVSPLLAKSGAMHSSHG
jgi:hypothetical protein